MAEKSTFDYGSNVDTWQIWRNAKLFTHATPLAHFGDLTGLKIVDLGCGDGSFLKVCVEKGAEFCLGIDIDCKLFDSATGGQRDSKRFRFQTSDCFTPFQANFGQFDLATAQFLLHHCENQDGLHNFSKNVFELLKPGGKLCISQCPMASSVNDQNIWIDFYGLMVPLKIDNQDVITADAIAYYPNLGGDQIEKPYVRKPLFTFHDDCYWSKEAIMKVLRNIGFINVRALKPIFPDHMNALMKKKLESLEEPFMLIAAEKPQA